MSKVLLVYGGITLALRHYLGLSPVMLFLTVLLLLFCAVGRKPAALWRLVGWHARLAHVSRTPRDVAERNAILCFPGAVAPFPTSSRCR